MYKLKKIIAYDEGIVLPKCMYTLKKIDEFNETNLEVDLNIKQQVKKFLEGPRSNIMELESRQDDLIKKLDYLYEKILKISSSCQEKSNTTNVQNAAATIPEEIVLSCNADNLPYFINIILKEIGVNFSWHIHSSVPSAKVSKIKALMKSVNTSAVDGKVTVRVIFADVTPQLKLNSLGTPIVGYVNILRYLAYAYPDVIPYDPEDFIMEGLLDICHVLETTSDKNREAALKNLFSKYNSWIYNNSFSIVDLAAFNVIKQWQSCPKCIPKEWFDKINKKL